METDLETNRQAILELMKSHWSDGFKEKQIRNLELLMERMIAYEEEAISENLRGIDGVPHLFRATRCLLEIAEKPPQLATIIAVLGHDWDRCVVRARVARDLFPRTASGYEAYKTSSAVVSALEFCNSIIPTELFEQSDIQLARERIVFHEKGHDLETDLIDAADCFIFFYVPNLNAYYRSDGEDGLRHKLRYQLPARASKYFKEVEPHVRKAINSSELVKSIVPILQDFMHFISTSEVKEAMMTEDKKLANTRLGQIDTGGVDFVGYNKSK